MGGNGVGGPPGPGAGAGPGPGSGAGSGTGTGPGPGSGVGPGRGGDGSPGTGAGCGDGVVGSGGFGGNGGTDMAPVSTLCRRTTSRTAFTPLCVEGTVCIRIRYSGIDAPTAAHIHDGLPGEVGPVVIDFESLITTSPPGQIRGGVAVDPALAADVAQNSAEFYVNVHTVPSLAARSVVNSTASCLRLAARRPV